MVQNREKMNTVTTPGLFASRWVTHLCASTIFEVLKPRRKLDLLRFIYNLLHANAGIV
jgi:hypothetical protein